MLGPTQLEPTPLQLDDLRKVVKFLESDTPAKRQAELKKASLHVSSFFLPLKARNIRFLLTESCISSIVNTCWQISTKYTISSHGIVYFVRRDTCWQISTKYTISSHKIMYFVRREYSLVDYHVTYRVIIWLRIP